MYYYKLFLLNDVSHAAVYCFCHEKIFKNFAMRLQNCTEYRLRVPDHVALPQTCSCFGSFHRP